MLTPTTEREFTSAGFEHQILATLSHELRTPLTAILGYARLLRAGTLAPPAVARALDVIERNTRAQSRIIDDLLDVSSIVFGTLRLERRPVPLAPIVAAEIDAAEPELNAAGLTLEWAAAPASPPVSGDAGRLQQVVRHLLSNAIKFTPAGGRIVVRLEPADDEVRLEIRDTGIGIDPGFLPHVFDRFRQADGSMTRAYGGLGVGLALVRHLVELHGGRVSADNADGGGAIFTVALPALHADDATRQPALIAP